VSEEPTRDEEWHKARSAAFTNIAQILAKVNAGRPGKQSILELNLAEARRMLEDSRESMTIASPSTVKQEPIEESPEIGW